MAAVNAFGAMCLNAQGLDMFNTEKPLPHFFDLMTSHDFLRNPMDVDRATGLGSTMDELIRHHPSLKPSVFQCVTSLIKKVIEMGSDMNGVGKSSDNSHLLQTSSEDTNMSTSNATTAGSGGAEEEDKPEKVECLLVSFIDLVSRFLEGLFQNQSNIKEFVEEGCAEMLRLGLSLVLVPHDQRSQPLAYSAGYCRQGKGIYPLHHRQDRRLSKEQADRVCGCECYRSRQN